MGAWGAQSEGRSKFPIPITLLRKMPVRCHLSWSTRGVLRWARLINLKKMPSTCSVHGCFSNSKKHRNVKFHRFPKNEEVRNRWIHLCGRQDPINADNALICSVHFELSAYKRRLKYELLKLPVPKRLVQIEEVCVPTLLLPSIKGKL